MSIQNPRLSLYKKSLGAIVLLLMMASACAQSGKAGSSITQFIRAVQADDLKSALMLLSSTRAEVRTIEDNNPRALRDKLVAQYYQQKVDQLSKDPGFWQTYAESLSVFMGSGSLQIVSRLLNFDQV